MSVMAQSGHPGALGQCPLLGVKRTSRLIDAMSVFDPKRTFPAGEVAYPIPKSLRLARGRETSQNIFEFLNRPRKIFANPKADNRALERAKLRRAQERHHDLRKNLISSKMALRTHC
jgi:hypothetical protein